MTTRRTNRRRTARVDSKLKEGVAVRRKVLGEEHVRRALETATEFDRDFQDFITRQAWGSIWTRPGIDLRTRSLITIAILSALGHEYELALHVRATRNTGATVKEIREVLMQVAVYAGVPGANTAFRIAKAELGASHGHFAREPHQAGRRS
jgi:4-carboxymuconolactone decarboxylase